MKTIIALMRRVFDRISLERDLRNWKRTLGPLRSAKRPSYHRTVLFCDVMTMLATAKMESLIAGLLRLNGYRTLVLLEKPNRLIEQIFAAAAPDAKFIYLNEVASVDQTVAAGKAANDIIASLSHLQELIDLEIDGFRIGRNVLSIVLRQLRAGRIDGENPAHRKLISETLARSLTAKGVIKCIVADHKPDLAVFNERGYTPAGEVFDGCVLAGVDTIQWCGAPRDDCLLYRRYNTNTRSEHPLTFSNETWRRIQLMRWTAENDRAVTDRIQADYASGAWGSKQQLQEGKTIITVDEFHRSLGLDDRKKTAVIFCHILYDATFFYGKSLFDDYEQWLVETVRSAIANPKLNWVVKVHPVNVWRSRMDGAPIVQLEAETLKRHFGSLPDHVKLMGADNGINTFSLFRAINYGLTVRGTIGLELPCFGIPVVTAGTGRYSGRGFTIDPSTRDAYREILANLHDMPQLSDQAARLARLHYFATFDLLPIPTSSFLFDFNAVRRVGMPPLPDVFVKERADESLLESNDLGRLIRWMTESRALELLARDIEMQPGAATAAVV